MIELHEQQVAENAIVKRIAAASEERAKKANNAGLQASG
jgi:hypothetical protein